jgi:hypothetical protein
MHTHLINRRLDPLGERQKVVHQPGQKKYTHSHTYKQTHIQHVQTHTHITCINRRLGPLSERQKVVDQPAQKKYKSIDLPEYVIGNFFKHSTSPSVHNAADNLEIRVNMLATKPYAFLNRCVCSCGLDVCVCVCVFVYACEAKVDFLHIPDCVTYTHTYLKHTYVHAACMLNA